MADLILNLISLKSKADAAGVGTTATNSTPSLCPTKSAIPGYVTNGASVVRIYNASSFSNNLLVPEAYVSVNKTPTGTATVYRSVSVGTSSASDIPASGGSSRASATVTYLQTTRTYYSDGTSTDGTWTNQSATIYGGYVSANSKGTTVSGRTPVNTSTPSGTVAGATRTASAVTIYLAANNITYESPHFSVTCSDAPAAGGYTGTPVINDYSQSYSFSSGSTGSTTSMGTVYYGTSSTLNNWTDPTSTNSDSGRIYCSASSNTSRHFVGECHVKIVANNKYNTWTTYLYQAANSASSNYLWFTGGQVSNVSNAGGTSTVPTTYDYRWYTVYSNGTESYTTLTSSLITWAYGKNSSNSYSGVSFSSSSSNCLYTVGANTGDEKTLGYAVVRGYYGGSYDYIVRQVKLSGGYVSGPTVTGYELKIRTNSITHIPNSGGTNNYVTLDWIRFYTNYSNGTSNYTTLSASLCTFLGYNRSSGTSEPSSGWSTDPSNSTYTVGSNTGNAKTIGYAFMKYRYVYGGTTYNAYDYSTITLDGGYVSSVVYKVYVVPLTYNGTTYTTPAVNFYNGSSTYAGSAHGRVNSTQTVSHTITWASTKVTGINIVENGNYNYVRYVTVRASDSSVLLEKYYIGNSSYPGYIPFSNGKSFNTSNYKSGQILYVYYYYS